MAQPRDGFGQAPLPSPHSVFGRLPSRWTRFWDRLAMGKELARKHHYWPTVGDVALFVWHMYWLRKGAPRPEGWQLCDPLLTGWRESDGPAWEHRQHVRMVAQRYRKARLPSGEWWEGLEVDPPPVPGWPDGRNELA